MKIAVLQLTSVLDYKVNLEVIRSQLTEAKSLGAVAFFMPEVFYSMSNGVTPGKDYKIVELDSVKIGLGICFDMRFSEMGLHYRMNGANIITYPAAFTVPTGKAHWHTLLRARAIENQCYVVAAAQWGYHNEKIQTYGHSVVFDPWGDTLLDLGDGVKVGVVELDFPKINLIRQSVLMNR